MQPAQEQALAEVAQRNDVLLLGLPRSLRVIGLDGELEPEATLKQRAQFLCRGLVLVRRGVVNDRAGLSVMGKLRVEVKLLEFRDGFDGL